LENLDDDKVDIKRACESIRLNIKASATESMGYYKSKQHKLLFDKECSKLLEQSKQAKLQWLHSPSQMHGDNLNNVRHEASTTFRNKKREYLKEKINDLETNRKKYK